MTKFIPSFEFIPFTGVVEDNVDPLKLGRVQVRIHGVYSDDETQVPTEDLPWAFVQYANSTRIDIPEIDEWVFGMFLDGKESQKPLIIGVLPGIVEEPIVEPSTSRFIRNEEMDDTEIKPKKDEPTSVRSITEPDNPYAAEYPFNKVFHSKVGHLIEIDDTEGAERIHIYHKSGTFTEVHPDGSSVERMEGDNYSINKANKLTIVLEDETREVEGNFHLETSSGSTVDLDDAGNIKLENRSGAVVEMASDSLISVQNNSFSIHDLLNDLLKELSMLSTSGSPSNHLINGNHASVFGNLLLQMKTLFK